VGFTALNSPEWWRLLLVILMYPVVQGTEGFVLTPRILGEKLELHPFVVLVGLILGHHLFGIIGIVLAAPVLASAKIFLTHFFNNYQGSAYYLAPAEGSVVVAEPTRTVKEGAVAGVGSTVVEGEPTSSSHN